MLIVVKHRDVEQFTQALLDLFAAGCDRKRYPKGKSDDVPDADPRCGAYLK